MKKFIAGLAVAVIALTFGANAWRADAQGPTNTWPGGAAGADNQFHFISPGAHLWYYFQYAGDNTQFSIVLVNGGKDNLDFNLYFPSQVSSTFDYDPKIAIGRGTRPGTSCPEGTGDCDSNNKIWLGTGRESGRHYVEVINNSSDAKPFLLKINGARDSLSLQPPTPTSQPTPAVATQAPRAVPTATPNAILTVMAQVAATLQAPADASVQVTPPASIALAVNTPTSEPTAITVATVGPTPTPTPPENNYYLTAAWVYDDRNRIIPPKFDLWFKFEHPGDKTVARIIVPDAVLSGLEFKVYTPDAVTRLQDEDKPIGVGTRPTVPCTDGKCTANDLIWSGGFNTAGTYFIRVSNTSDKYANLRMLITGAGVVQGH